MIEDATKQAIREALHRRNLSARAASLRAGLGPNTLNHYLRGQTGSLNQSTLIAVSEALGVDLRDLVTTAGQASGATDGGPSEDYETVHQAALLAAIQAIESQNRAILAELRALRATVRDALKKG